MRKCATLSRPRYPAGVTFAWPVQIRTYLRSLNEMGRKRWDVVDEFFNSVDNLRKTRWRYRLWRDGKVIHSSGFYADFSDAEDACMDALMLGVLDNPSMYEKRLCEAFSVSWVDGVLEYALDEPEGGFKAFMDAMWSYS